MGKKGRAEGALADLRRRLTKIRSNFRARTKLPAPSTPILFDWALQRVHTSGLLEWRCFYCGVKMDGAHLSLDHRVPVKRGGPNGLENLVISCEACNQLKSGLLSGEFAALLDLLRRFTPESRAEVRRRLRETPVFRRKAGRRVDGDPAQPEPGGPATAPPAAAGTAIDHS